MPKRRHALAVATIAVVGVAGACTRAGNTEGTPSAQVQKAESILAELVPNSAGDQFQLALAAHTERITAACMADHGFRYRPKDPRSLVDVTTDTDFASLDYARKYGFGVTATPVFAATPDPNAGYLESLSSARRKSFDAQLSSCADPAAAAAKQQDGVTQAEQLFSRTDQLVQADSAYRAAEQAWARCAAAAGYPQPSRLDLINWLSTQRDEIINRPSSTAPPQSPAASRDAVAQYEQDPGYRDLQRRERAAAVATFACSQDLDRVYRERYQALR